MKRLILDELLADVEDAIFIFPHPDDEVLFSSGLALRLIEYGIKTRLTCLTRGEASTLNYVNSNDLAKTRERELRAASQVIGYHELSVQDFKDGELAAQSGRLAKYLSGLPANNSLAITYEPGGITGHEDHKIASNLVASHFNKVLYCTVSDEFVDRVSRTAIQGIPDPMPPSFYIKLNDNELDKKLTAICKHQSQWGIQAQYNQDMWDTRDDLKTEYFAFA